MQINDEMEKVREQWKTVRPELDTFPLETVGRILRIEFLSKQKMKHIFSRYKIDRGGLDVLASLRRIGAPYQATPTWLYKILVLTSGAMTHRMDSLERSGLVERFDNPEDRRGLIIGLTKKGLVLIDQIMNDYIKSESDIIAHLSKTEQSTLAELLKKILLKMETENEEE